MYMNQQGHILHKFVGRLEVLLQFLNPQEYLELHLHPNQKPTTLKKYQLQKYQHLDNQI